MQNMEKIVVSVIVLAYNHEKYICQAIDSILEQKTNFKIEILVNDDCSTDNTQKILKEKYKDKVKLFLRKKNIGANRGYCDMIHRSKGKYITTLEGDDYWCYTEKLQMMVDFLETHLNYIGVSHWRKTVDMQGKYGPVEYTKGRVITMEKYLRGEVMFSAVSTLFRNSIKNIDISVVYKADKNRGDSTWNMLWLNMGDIYVFQKAWGIYRVRQNARRSSNYNSLYSRTEIGMSSIHICKVIEKWFDYKYSMDFYILSTAKELIKYLYNEGKYTYLIKVIYMLGIKRSMLLLKEYVGCLLTHSTVNSVKNKS